MIYECDRGTGPPPECRANGRGFGIESGAVARGGRRVKDVNDNAKWSGNNGEK